MKKKIMMYMIKFVSNCKTIVVNSCNKVISSVIKVGKNKLDLNNRIINILLRNFTKIKCISAFFSILMIASLKYLISGNFDIEYSEILNNVALVLLSWTMNSSIISWIINHYGIKGINFNLKGLIYGYHTIGVDNTFKSKDIKSKLYNAMDSNEDSSSHMDIDKQDAMDFEYDTAPNKDIGRDSINKGNNEENIETITNSINKGKGKDVEPEQGKEPSFAVWRKVFPHLDPEKTLLPKPINPGPGFNVPGGDVPIRDSICEYIYWNTHILKQFRTMDYKTALEQRQNYAKWMQIIHNKTIYAENYLRKMPEVPLTDEDRVTREKVLEDLADLNVQRGKANARYTLINSRVEFIELQINKKPNE